jgi:uncharacterized membrane protein
MPGRSRSSVTVIPGRSRSAVTVSVGTGDHPVTVFDGTRDQPVTRSPRLRRVGSLRVMAESSTQSLTMAAPPVAIMGVIADFPAYPEWAAAVKTVEVLDAGRGGRAKRVRFSIDAGLIKDTYELDYTWAADGLSVSWDLVSGQIQKAQHGSYLLRPAGDATEVTYTLSVELTIPLIGVLRRKAERTIMDTALKELRKRVEARA